MQRSRGYNWAILECLALVLLCVAAYSIFDMEKKATDNRILAANTGFGFHLFQKVCESGRDRNVFISPASVTMALAMAYNGADGETRRVMAQALEIGNETLQEVNAANLATKAALETTDPKVKIAIANSLWARKSVLFERAFIKRTEKFYEAEVRSLDFDTPDAVPTINSWVRKCTHGRIREIVADPIPSATLLYLINAVYFKGEWTRAFDKQATHDAEFQLPDGTSRTCALMNRSGYFRYYEGDGFQAVSIPYGQEKISMYVFLPAEDSCLTSFCRELSKENWEYWMKRFDAVEGHVGLPRFKFEYEALLNEPLKTLGMEIAFLPTADFRAMTPTQAFISEVKHKAFVEVNEAGIEAAAATQTEVGAGVDPPSLDFEMVMNRPFFFAIRDEETGTILFMGTVVNPA